MIEFIDSLSAVVIFIGWILMVVIAGAAFSKDKKQRRYIKSTEEFIKYKEYYK